MGKLSDGMKRLSAGFKNSCGINSVDIEAMRRKPDESFEQTHARLRAQLKYMRETPDDEFHGFKADGTPRTRKPFCEDHGYGVWSLETEV